MAKVVEELPPEISTRITVKRWEMRSLSGTRRYRELNARCLPTIAIAGELVYESLIPNQDELIDEIMKRWTRQNKDESP